MRSLLLFAILSLCPTSVVAQAEPVVEVPDQARVSLFLVLVEEHDFGEAPAVVRYFGEEPLSNLNPVVLVRSRGASPMVIQAAGRVVLGMMERGLPVEGQELAVPVPVTPGVDRPAQWAASALANLRSAKPVDLPHLGSHRTLSFGAPAGLVRRPDPGSGGEDDTPFGG
jgi:hypothetical protein